MSSGTSCPGIFQIYVGINHCHFTGSTYAKLLCNDTLVQYVYYNDSQCSSRFVTAVNQVTETCNDFFQINNINIYGSLSQCISNDTVTEIPISTTFNVTTEINNTQVPATTSHVTSIPVTSMFGTNNSATLTLPPDLTSPYGTNSSGSGKKDGKRRKDRIIPGMPTIMPRDDSSSVSIFSLNNIVLITFIILVVNIAC
jgi:hypothetical protein